MAGARAVAALLAAAVQHVLQGNTAPGIQRTGSLWPVELVAGKAEQVNVRGLHINGQVPGSLYSISVEQRAALPAEGAKFRNGLHGADFVVGKHDADQAGIRLQGVRQLLRGDKPGGARRQQGYSETLRLQRL